MPTNNIITAHPYFINYRVDNESQLPLCYIKKVSTKKTVVRIRSDLSTGNIFFFQILLLSLKIL